MGLGSQPRQGQDREVGWPCEHSARGVGHQEEGGLVPLTHCSCSCHSTPLHTYHFPGLGSNLSNLLQQIPLPTHSANLHPKDNMRVAFSTPPFAEARMSAKEERTCYSVRGFWQHSFLLRLNWHWFPQAPAPTQGQSPRKPVADSPHSQQRRQALLVGFLAPPTRPHLLILANSATPW